MSMQINSSNYHTTASAAARLRAQPSAAELAKKLLASADSDQGGGISKTEFTTLLQDKSSSTTSSVNNTASDDLFGQLDTDSDGTLNVSETEQAVTNLLDQLHSQQQAQGNRAPPPPPTGGGGPPGSAKAAEELLKQADSNKNGVLDATEFTTALQGTDSSQDSNNTSRISDMFKSADNNGDGNVTSDELKSAMEANRPQPPSAGEKTGTSSDRSNTKHDVVSWLVNTMMKQYSSVSQNATVTSSLSLTA